MSPANQRRPRRSFFSVPFVVAVAGVAGVAGVIGLGACELGSAAKGADRPDLAGAGTAVPDLLGAGPSDLSTGVSPSTMDLSQVPPLAAGFNDPSLAARQLDYGLALRSASLKLVGDLPSSDEIATLGAAANAIDAANFYRGRVEAYLADPRFSVSMIAFFRNTFRAGGLNQNNQSPASFETAATFAAQLVIADRPFTDVVTAAQGTCPTFNVNNGTFTAANCNNGVPMAAGVLSDPGVQALNFSNMAFRRARWIQETFACSRFPAEFRNPPIAVGGGLYTSPWPFLSISGMQTGGPVDFLESKTLICANCHSTINHLAPLLASFDAAGQWQNSIQVSTPIVGLPVTKPADWLPMGEATSWRWNVPAADLPGLGAAIAADGVFADCMTTRVYDWAMSKGEVLDEPPLPPDVLQPFREERNKNGFKLKNAIRIAFTSDDFVRF